MTRLLLLHGLGCAPEFWAPQVEALSGPGREVLAPALPYHGGPTQGVEPSIAGLARWVEGLLEDRPAVLLGHSLGGMIALQIATSRPDLVARIVLVDAFANLRLNEAYLPEMFVEGVHAEVREWVEARRKVVLQRMPAATYEAIWATVADFDATPYLDRLAAPLLGIYGSRGRYEPGDEERLRHDLCLDLTARPSEVAVVEKAGHFVNLEEAEQVNAMIAGWLASPGP